MQSVTLSYKLKLYPTRAKADTLALLSGLFRQSHTDCTLQLRAMEQPRLPSTKGMGELIGRAYRRAEIDYKRTTKAGHTPGFLHAELIDSADLQLPKRAKAFDYWILLKGTKDKFYIPAKGHRALNRTLALPGAKLNTGKKGSAFVMRKNGKWYVYVNVSVPLAAVQEPKGWLGCDIGARSAVVRSDGYKAPDLRPLFQRDKERQRNHAYCGIERHRTLTPAGQLIAHEARKTVLVAQRSGRGVSLEAPKNLVRWKKHAARLFAKRVLLLADIYGVAVQEINPAYTSTTCSRCGLVNRNMRHKEAFRCWRCGFTHNSDFNAALNLCHRAYRVTAVHHGLLRSSPGGVGANE